MEKKNVFLGGLKSTADFFLVDNTSCHCLWMQFVDYDRYQPRFTLVPGTC